MARIHKGADIIRPVQLPTDSVVLHGDLGMPVGARGIVLFAHGSGSSRHSPRNRHVAKTLRDAALATLLFDLLTPEEERIDAATGHLRFDIGMLADRLARAADWLTDTPYTSALKIGAFGASTGGGAALACAAQRPEQIKAVVSRGGRLDLAGPWLPLVKAPTLLLVGERDTAVIRMNRDAMEQMTAPVQLEIVAGATHLFEEPGTLDAVSRAASEFFTRHLT